MPLVLKSTLLTREQMGVERERSIRVAAEAKLLEMAEAALGPAKRLIIRDLTPEDLEVASNEWLEETAGTADEWADTDISGDMADNRFVAILGMYFGRCPTTPPISLWKFTVGGSEVARWDLYPLQPRMVDPGQNVPPIGVAEAPIFISQNTPFAIAEYTIEAANPAYFPRIFGLVCEPEGKTLKG